MPAALMEENFAAFLGRTVARYAERPAVTYQEKSWTYRQLEQEQYQYAAALAAQGIKKGSHVALFAELSPQSLFVFYALMTLGAVAVMINTALEAAELACALNAADCTHICIGQAHKPERCLEEIAAAAVKKHPLRILLLQELEEAAEQMEAWQPGKGEAVSPSDTATILFTSGSTSKPKAVMSSHFSRINSAIQQAHDMRTSYRDRFCVAMPAFHCFCISVNLLAAVACGGCLCIPHNRRTGTILSLIYEKHCTVLSAVPTMYQALMQSRQFDATRLISLRTGIIGGSHYPPALFQEIEQTMHLTLLSSLGQTECTAGLTICSLTDSLELRSRTVGRFMAHIEGKIADMESGQALPPGEKGEICIRGYLLMQGYYRRPELTAQVIDADGWLHTGDMGRQLPDGSIELCGRKKELIIRGGENISPCEIELVLAALAEVEQCKVVGVTDAHYGEELCACIVLAQGAKADAIRIKQQLEGRLASFKIPKHVLFWSGFPMTSSGKVSVVETARRAGEQLRH